MKICRDYFLRVTLSEIGAQFEEILESLTEEEREADTINESGDSFVNAAVIKEAKSFQIEAKKTGAFEAESYEAKILQVAELITEEKQLKATIKKEAAALHLLTKSTIEGLSDMQVHELLELKWICPLNAALHQLPTVLIEMLTVKLQALADKYTITYADNARAIQLTESSLAKLIDELDGNAFDMQGLDEFKFLLKGK